MVRADCDVLIWLWKVPDASEKRQGARSKSLILETLGCQSTSDTPDDCDDIGNLSLGRH